VAFQFPKNTSRRLRRIAVDGIRMRISSSFRMLSRRALAVFGAVTIAVSVAGAVASTPAAYATPPTGHNAIVENAGCTQNSFPRVDDTSLNFALPFSANWFGTTYNDLWVNSNGGVNLAMAWSAYSNLDLHSIAMPVIAPLFTDLDTRNTATNVDTYGVIADYHGHQAFCANWVNVGHFANSGPEYSAQLLIVDRSDTGAGNVDVIFNYDWIADGSPSLTVGYAAADGTSYEFPGSGTNALTDSNLTTSLVNHTLNSNGQLGRYTFPVRGGYPPRAQTITFTSPGDQVAGTTLALGATASSGLSVSYTATGQCHVNGNALSFDVAGSCAVTAHQAGDIDHTPAWNAAAGVTRTFAVAPAPLTISTTTPPHGVVGRAYKFVPARSGGTGPYTWSIASESLPAGLHLDAVTGTVSGTPANVGSANVTLRVTDSLATTATQTFAFTVNPALGYRLVGRDGGVFAFGAAPFAGSLADRGLGGPIVGIASPANATGYYLAGSDGGVFAFGGARYQGSLAGRRLRAPVVGVASTSDGQGYWLATADGAVYPFGSAKSYGRITTDVRRAPVVGIAATPDGRGYWLATSAGALFPFGSASAAGRVGVAKPTGAIVGVASSPSGQGAWLVNTHGDVFAFGDAPTLGSLPPAVRRTLTVPVVGITAAPTGGYWVVASNSAVFSFGAPFLGNAGGARLHAPIVGIGAGR
jgi:hypothetical protein